MSLYDTYLTQCIQAKEKIKEIVKTKKKLRRFKYN